MADVSEAVVEVLDADGRAEAHPIAEASADFNSEEWPSDGRPRVVAGVSYEDYARRPGVNWSTLKAMGDSPLHYQHRTKHSKPATAAMQMGTAGHIATLEPHRWDEAVAVWDGGRRAGKAYKEWSEQNEGLLQLKPDEADNALAIGEAVRGHYEARELLKKGQAEVILEWTDKETGLECKARVDWLHIGKKRATLVDLKTARTMDRRAFQGAVARYGYHGQLAHYKAGVEAVTGLPCDVFIIGVESSAPYDVGVFILDDGVPDGALHVGEVMRRELLTKLAECRRLGHWPGRYERVEPLSLPAWALIGDEMDDFTFGGER